MEIKASDVKALREATGAGLMDCKKALTEANGDAKEAEKILKEKGLAAVAKRAERATSEGRVFVRTQDKKIALIEVTCETDFVANNSSPPAKSFSTSLSPTDTHRLSRPTRTFCLTWPQRLART